MKALYRRRTERLTQYLQYLQKRSSTYSWNRLKIFLTGLIITITLFAAAGDIAGLIAAGITIAVFSVAVHLHNRIIINITRVRVYLSIYRENLARAELNWEGIPACKVEPYKDHPYETDLDITGEKSLHRLIDTSASQEGSERLREYFTQKAPQPEIIQKRAVIVNELTKKDIFRKKLELKVRLLSKKRLEVNKASLVLSEIAKNEKPSFIMLAVLSALVFTYLTLLILYGFELVPSVWLVPFVIYIGVYNFSSRKIGHIYEDAMLIEDEIRKLGVLLGHIETLPGKEAFSELLKDFRSSKPSGHFIALEKALSALESSHNPVMKIALNFFMPWDYYNAVRIWRASSAIAPNLRRWLDTLHDVEALSSLANFAELNPAYTFAGIEDKEDFVFSASGLGHPLLPGEVRIKNNFSFTKEKEIVIITGSNMSGKSTFIKTMGVNLVLAFTGAPVCSASLSTSLYRLFTCIKVSDSVTDGLSYFYAEVKRLKALLDDLEEQNKIPLLYLIDEIFKGTNNRERLTGSRSYIKALAGKHGTGAITTHDLELVKLEQEINFVKNYHFREDVIEGKMIFDYKIHPGPSPTTNALKVMKIAGLPVGDG